MILETASVFVIGISVEGVVRLAAKRRSSLRPAGRVARSPRQVKHLTR